MVMVKASLGCGPDLDVAVQYVAEPVTQPQIQIETIKPFTQNLP